jgi:hypothetical protein
MANSAIYFNIIVRTKQEDEWVIYLKFSYSRESPLYMVLLRPYPEIREGSQFESVQIRRILSNCGYPLFFGKARKFYVFFQGVVKA